MTTTTAEERLARIEEKLAHVVKGLSSVNEAIDKIVVPRFTDIEKRLVELETSDKIQKLSYKILLGVLAVAGIGGGGSLLTQILTGASRAAGGP